MNVPAEYLTGLKSFYTNCVHIIKFRGNTSHRFLYSNGIKQGCPLAGVIFAVVLDPFVRCVNSFLLKRNGTIRAYADDIFTFLANYLDLTAILALFGTWRRISNMMVNYSKVYAIPLFCKLLADLPSYLAKCRRKVARCIDNFDVNFTFAAKYLGVVLGFFVGTQRWADALEAYRVTCRALKGYSLGLPRTVRLYNTQALPKLSYLAAHSDPTPQALSTEHFGLQLLSCAPWHTFPDTLLWNLSQIGFTISFDSLDRLAIASKFRVYATHHELIDSIWASVLSMMATNPFRANHVVLKDFLSTSVVCSLLRNYHELVRLLPAVDGLLHDPPAHLQARIIKEIRPFVSRDPGLGITVGRRLQRLIPARYWPRLEVAVTLTLKSLSPAPLYALASVLRFCCNGFHTEERYGLVRTCGCRFGCGGLDSIEHYEVSTHYWRCLATLFPRLTLQFDVFYYTGLAHFLQGRELHGVFTPRYTLTGDLLIGRKSVSHAAADTLMLGICIHLLETALNAQRHRYVAGSMAVMTGHMRARLKTLCHDAPKLLPLIQSMR